MLRNHGLTDLSEANISETGRNGLNALLKPKYSRHLNLRTLIQVGQQAALARIVETCKVNV